MLKLKGPLLVVVSSVALLMLFAGCATPARTAEMRIDSVDAAKYSGDTPLKDEIAVKEVTGGTETNPMWTSEIGSDEFRQALVDSLAAVDLLDVDESPEYELYVQMLEVKQPLIGIDFTVVATVRYTLLRASDGAELFDEKITASYTAQFSDALLALERLKLANEGAGRENITELIEVLYLLETSDLRVAVR